MNNLLIAIKYKIYSALLAYAIRVFRKKKSYATLAMQNYIFFVVKLKNISMKILST